MRVPVPPVMFSLTEDFAVLCSETTKVTCPKGLEEINDDLITDRPFPEVRLQLNLKWREVNNFKFIMYFIIMFFFSMALVDSRPLPRSLKKKTF